MDIFFNAGSESYNLLTSLDYLGAKLYEYSETSLHEDEEGNRAVIVPFAQFNAILVVIAMMVKAIESGDIRIE